MSVLDFEIRDEATKEKKTASPAKIIVLALAKSHRGVRAKMLAEALHKRFPEDYHQPLIKFYHDIGWRDTLIRLRKVSKTWDYMAPVIVFVDKKLIGDDDDFNLYISEKHFLVADAKKINIFKDMGLLDKLQMDPLKTYVYFDIAIDYHPVGRMIFQIDADVMPQSTKGFLELCCSQRIPLPDKCHKRSKFAGGLIRRIVREGWIRIQSIDNERIYANGKYEKPSLTHNKKGTLSMNIGPRGWLSSHILITLDQHPWMDKSYRALGTLIDGEHVLHQLENVPTTYENPNVDVIVMDNGILHSPNLRTTEGFLTPEMLSIAAKLKAFKEEYKKLLTAYVNSTPCIEPEYKREEPDEIKPSVDDEVNKIDSNDSIYEAVDGTARGASNEAFLRMQSTSEIETLPSWRNQANEMSKVAVWSQAIKKVKAKSQMFGVEESTKSRKLGEEKFEEEEEIEKPVLSEPDIKYTYVVPKGIADIRTGYKKFEDGRRVETYQKVGMKLPKKRELGKYKSNSDSPKEDFDYITPHERIEKDDDQNHYYEIPQRAMSQVTPQLLLTWAQGIDDDAEVCEIEKAVDDLLNTAVLCKEDADLEGHPLDARSIENFDERFKRCLLSLPTKVLHILHENLQDIKVKQDNRRQPLQIKGDSSSSVSQDTGTRRFPSEDVVSGCILSVIEFTRRMVESSTELVPDMKNVDFMLSIIDEVILEKVHKFITNQEKKDQQSEMKLDHEYQYGRTEALPYTKETKKTNKNITYFPNTNTFPGLSNSSLQTIGAVNDNLNESAVKNVRF